MIFVTVGTQLAFPRLMDAMAALAPELAEPILAQTGESRDWPGLECHPGLSPAAFGEAFGRARVVVAHAGMGTVLSARAACKPLVLLPRRHALGEHRNDHQLATARALEGAPGIYVAWQAEDLGPLLRRDDLLPAGDAPGPAREALIVRLAAFIREA